MATYKLLQDVEAEDHILGPLTLRQFIFAMIACFLYYICFLLVTKGLTFMLIIFLPPTLFFTFFAMPLGRDQPTEVWALAKLRYFFKPRKRVWNQDGVKELVTITAPKKIERALTNGLDQIEVKSRLQALADTLDSRGWAVKNVLPGTYASPVAAMGADDRLIDMSSMAMPSDNDLPAAADIMDETASPIAQQFDAMINQSEQAHRQQIVAQLNSHPGASQPTQQRNDYWFMNGNPHAVSAVPAPEPASLDRQQEKALASQLKSQAASRPSPYSNLRTVRPLGAPEPTSGSVQDPAQPNPQPVTSTPDPAILSLAKNDDLNVSTLAREAKRANHEGEDEVVIPLR